MQWDFANVCAILQSGTPPEITHFRNGNHPGKSWWLKTVVPASAQCPLTEIWNRLAHQHPQLITWVLEAYDWQQQRIQGAHSIWLRNDVDIHIDYQDPHFDYHILPFEDSFNVSGQQLHQQLTHRAQRDFKQNHPQDWHKLKSLANFMSTWTTDSQADVRRKTWRLIASEEIDSQAHQGAQLDHQ